MRILVPVDGSDNALRAVDYAISTRDLYKEPAEIHLLNAQRPVVSGNVRAFISQEQLHNYYEEEGTLALNGARERLDGSGIAHSAHVAVGEEAASISQYAAQHDCKLIVMGTRGMGSIANLLLGSVAAKVVHLAPVPVVLVK
ncbi:MAG: universal stress protein [Betaproteobacteria bacterium]|nr:universal stress protein [Betaproteobacteria bacterium]